MAQLNADGFNRTELASEGSYPDWEQHLSHKAGAPIEAMHEDKSVGGFQGAELTSRYVYSELNHRNR